MHLDRRDFLKKGFAVGAAFSLADLSGLFAAEPAPAAAGRAPHLVAVRNGTRIDMLNAAIAALGGMKAFVKPGQTVVIKPNIGWDVVPELGANTHPDIVRRLVELCDEAGAKEISVFDNTCDAWQRAYAHSGIEKALEGTRAKLINGKDESMYRVVTVAKATKLLDVKVHSLILDSDVYINAPVLKHHSGATMTCAMKNAMGVVWDRRYWHKNDLHQCIAEFQTFKKPALNIVDAYHPMMRNGPRGTNASDVVEMKCLIASTDPVAADAAAAKLLGHQPADIRYIPIAATLGLGSMDLDKMNIQRLQLSV
ncbi:MAG: tat (twin-arginine translocation) pathway signal sequence [Verrucomicrobia bacterium Tous-C9LFEB]|nr:MAG: tat (twin-arginine translocation) pathway signal sequence [Verrucomicrobia bacterium Tous-C9LFEB]